ncbi:hypothetical protein BJF85_18215 [Saccharomonospora sp. CUA-673]|uniref:DUF3618 domain-containing protein n=1 Tax=Saccharomonospora sp. CUA-673 TaxID=1904969 RepID=UPI00095B6A77|nr:DUF3618 domain-containing protein [Saccharomonospora sp. CUA-673]OLT45912.1 hypothetical protein BJF85_18215 [Saccharomonospora sp. CUA-673]
MNERDESSFPKDPHQARVDIELTRKELGETARALAYKLDVPNRAKDLAAERTATVRSRLRTVAVAAAAHAQGRIDRLRSSSVDTRGPVVVATLAVLVCGGVIVWRATR